MRPALPTSHCRAAWSTSRARGFDIRRVLGDHEAYRLALFQLLSKRFALSRVRDRELVSAPSQPYAAHCDRDSAGRQKAAERDFQALALLAEPIRGSERACTRKSNERDRFPERPSILPSRRRLLRASAGRRGARPFHPHRACPLSWQRGAVSQIVPNVMRCFSPLK